ncbi:MAG: hypothetical protein WCR56_04630 [Bacilli bacterium]
MTRKKFFLCFDPLKLTQTLSYTIKENLTHFLDRMGYQYTFKADDDYDEIIAGSGEDLFARYSQIRTDKPITLLGCFNIDDLAIAPKNPDPFLLSQASYNYYHKASQILVPSKMEADYLTQKGFTQPIFVFHVQPTFLEDKPVSEEERNSFRSFYQIPEDKSVFVSYGSYTDKDEFSAMESISGVSPDKEFLFFGHNDRNFVTLKTLERLTKADNIRYLETMPEELYHSMLLNIDALIFTQRFLAFPNIIVDAIYNHIPIISYHGISLPALVNEKTAMIPKNFKEFYETVMNIKTINHSQQAYDSLMQALKSEPVILS